jgi:hypothetical protein
MWKVYGDRGYAIQTTFERVQAAFESSPGLVQGCPVDYLDFSRDSFDIGNVFTAVTKKDLPYKDEREFGLLFWRVDPANSAIAVEADGGGVKVAVDLSMLVETIYVSPQITAVPPELSRLVEANNLQCSFAPSGIREA